MRKYTIPTELECGVLVKKREGRKRQRAVSSKERQGKNEKEDRRLKRNRLKVYGKLQKVRGCKISLLRLFMPAYTKLKKTWVKNFNFKVNSG